MRLLIIPEDFRNDQYILLPLFQRLLSDLNKPRAKIEICKDPLLGGYVEALKTARLEEIVERYQGMVDVFVLCVDRDANANRKNRLDEIERHFEGRVVFFAENAWQELEAWVLAGLQLPANWVWADIRAHRDVKEAYFAPYAKARGVSDGPGGGRKALAKEASASVGAIRLKCREDFDCLARRIEAVL